VSSFFGTKDTEGKTTSGGKLGSTTIFHQLPLTLNLIVHKKQTKNVTVGVQIDLKIQKLNVPSPHPSTRLVSTPMITYIFFYLFFLRSSPSMTASS